MPADNVCALLEAVARVKGRGVWDEWESWALRHAIPVHELVAKAGLPGDGLTVADRLVLCKRLRDLLGYCLLGLVLAERTDE